MTVVLNRYTTHALAKKQLQFAGVIAAVIGAILAIFASVIAPTVGLVAALISASLAYLLYAAAVAATEGDVVRISFNAQKYYSAPWIGWLGISWQRP